jgi:SAM-dependent methyltransferase
MEWYPTPSYLVKRKVIIDLLRGIPCGRFLEVGCGAGDLLADLAQRGYRGLGIDYSREAVTTARTRLSSGNVTVQEMTVEELSAVFDVVIASEVLEHHDDDLLFLKKLSDRLKPGGHLILTVPAHRDKWGANDDLCGHVRRYERDELRGKIEATGLRAMVLWSYGVPVYNLMKPWYDRAVARQVRGDEGAEERTRQSGGMKFPGMEKLFRILFNDITMSPFYLIQRMFFRTDLGNGYVVLAEKPRGNLTP